MKDEIRDGVHLSLPNGQLLMNNNDDEEGQPLRSQMAGRSAVKMTVAARVLAATPVLLVPPLVVEWLARRSPLFYAHQSVLRIPTLLACLGLSIQFAVVSSQDSCVCVCCVFEIPLRDSPWLTPLPSLLLSCPPLSSPLLSAFVFSLHV